jgi:sugar lactone lactonase YvrE
LLGPATELVYETPSPFLWTIAAAADGALFIGTGNDGRVFKVDAQGKGAPFFDAQELEVHAVAPTQDGGLYVATSPDGKIYKVDRSGNATTFFDPSEKYIWAMVADRRGNVYAATGEGGAIYRITPDGKSARFYVTKATHATALALDRDDNLLVGTESPGRVLRVDAAGRGFVLLDSPFQEIRALRFDASNVLYVAAVNGSATGIPAPKPDDRPGERQGDPAPAPVPSVSAEITSFAIVDTQGGATTTTVPRDDRRAPRGAVYRIAPDGLWDQLWLSREDTPYDVILDQEGRLVIATGSNGKIFRLEGDPLQPTLLARANAQQVTALHRDTKGRLIYATANPGKIHRLTAGRAARGTYESEPRDAQMVSSWGTLSWRGLFPQGSRVEISTRSGNTAVPDETWSPWSPPYTTADGSPIASPNARFLQFRVALSGKGEGPALTSLTAAYLQRNVRPAVRSITVHPPGIVFQKPFTTGDPELAGFENQTTPERSLAMAAMSPQQGALGSPSLGRRTYQKGLQTLIWRAEDDNSDDLVFDIEYRREGETAWKLLRTEVKDAILVWDTTTVPNGTYFVKVVASDAPSNRANVARAGELVSSAFEIDNTAPIIDPSAPRQEGTRMVVAFRVTDDHSPIERVEYSQDGQQWRQVFPMDGIADSRSERYEIALEGPIGPRGVTLRASDAMNNTATTQVDPPRPR